jgi:class 3 adenylate cyclase/cold shock CspA family protein
METKLAESVAGFLTNLTAAKVRTTFLFVDLFNSTEYKLLRPDVEWVATIAQFYSVAIANIEEKRGTVIKFIGDAVMGAFEKPDDALNAAIGLQEEMEKKRKEERWNMRCKIGIATGEAYRYKTNDDRYDYLGATVDLAARLCDFANGNAILLSGKTYNSADAEAISSSAGRTLGRTTEEYFGQRKEEKLKGIKDPTSYFALFWQAQPEGYVTTQAVAQPQPPAPASPTPPTQPTPQVPKGSQQSSARRLRGSVSRIIDGKSYGFISFTSPTGLPESLFFHKSSVLQGSPITEGSIVHFLQGLDENGRSHATSVIAMGSELRGKVARYDPAHFGFLTVRDAEANRIDFFLLPREVRGVISAEAEVVFVADETPRGLMAKDVRRIGDDETTRPSCDHLNLEALEHGIVDFLDPERGHGFILCRGNRVFVHFTEIMEENRDLEKGAPVEFTVAAGRDGGYRATRVHRILDKPPAVSS